MAKFKHLPFGSRRSPFRNERSVFVVPDLATQAAASDALARVRLPGVPELKTLGKAQTVGERLLRKLNRRPIKIVERPGISRDEAYSQNSKTLKLLVEQRDALTVVIADMVQPVISVVTGHSKKIDELLKEHERLEERVRQLEEMMRAAFGKVPEPQRPPGKMLWRGQLQEAAKLVREMYNEDLSKSEPNYRDLRDASDNFFDNHVFVHKPDLTRLQFYDNVKKAA